MLHAASGANGRMRYATLLPTRLDGKALPTRFEYSYSGLSACSERVRANESEAKNEKLRQLSAALLGQFPAPKCVGCVSARDIFLSESVSGVAPTWLR